MRTAFIRFTSILIFFWGNTSFEKMSTLFYYLLEYFIFHRQINWYNFAHIIDKTQKCKFEGVPPVGDDSDHIVSGSISDPSVHLAVLQPRICEFKLLFSEPDFLVQYQLTVILSGIIRRTRRWTLFKFTSERWSVSTTAANLLRIAHPPALPQSFHL